jgi:hypothetical protein
LSTGVRPTLARHRSHDCYRTLKLRQQAGRSASDASSRLGTLPCSARVAVAASRLGLDEGDPRPHDPSVGLGKDGDCDGFRFCPCFEIRS